MQFVEEKLALLDGAGTGYQQENQYAVRKMLATLEEGKLRLTQAFRINAIISINITTFLHD